jgi:hypothetical protein
LRLKVEGDAVGAEGFKSPPRAVSKGTPPPAVASVADDTGSYCGARAKTSGKQYGRGAKRINYDNMQLAMKGVPLSSLKLWG